MKKNRKKIKRREYERKEPINHRVLNSINSPNPWTPEVEDAWLKELYKISASEIYTQFPPIRKPPHISRRSKSYGFGYNT